MKRLALLGGHVYVSGLLLAVLGIVAGYLVFFQVYPGKPKIGIIDIPFTVITDIQPSRLAPIWTSSPGTTR